MTDARGPSGAAVADDSRRCWTVATVGAAPTLHRLRRCAPEPRGARTRARLMVADRGRGDRRNRDRRVGRLARLDLSPRGGTVAPPRAVLGGRLLPSKRSTGCAGLGVRRMHAIVDRGPTSRRRGLLASRRTGSSSSGQLPLHQRASAEQAGSADRGTRCPVEHSCTAGRLYRWSISETPSRAMARSRLSVSTMTTGHDSSEWLVELEPGGSAADGQDASGAVLRPQRGSSAHPLARTRSVAHRARDSARGHRGPSGPPADFDHRRARSTPR